MGARSDRQEAYLSQKRSENSQRTKHSPLTIVVFRRFLFLVSLPIAHVKYYYSLHRLPCFLALEIISHVRFRTSAIYLFFRCYRCTSRHHPLSKVSPGDEITSQKRTQPGLFPQGRASAALKVWYAYRKGSTIEGGPTRFERPAVMRVKFGVSFAPLHNSWTGRQLNLGGR